MPSCTALNVEFLPHIGVFGALQWTFLSPMIYIWTESAGRAVMTIWRCATDLPPSSDPCRMTKTGNYCLSSIVRMFVFVPTSKTISRTPACFWRFLCRCLRPADKLWYDWIVGTVFWPVSSAKFSSGTWWTPLTNMRLSSWRSSTARSWRAPPRRVWTLTTRMRRRSVLPQNLRSE